MLGYRGRAERVEFNFATPSLAVEGLSLAKYHGCKTEQLLEITLPHAPRSSGSQSAGRSDPGQGAANKHLTARDANANDLEDLFDFDGAPSINANVPPSLAPAPGPSDPGCS
jgi:hypothetical protein